jgi:hypothetical protein
MFHFCNSSVDKIIVICVSRPKSTSLSSESGFLAEAQPRLKTDEDRRHFLTEVHIEFFRRLHELQTKNRYIYKLSTIFFIVFICYQIVNKTRNLLFAIQLLIYIIL